MEVTSHPMLTGGVPAQESYFHFSTALLNSAPSYESTHDNEPLRGSGFPINPEQKPGRQDAGTPGRQDARTNDEKQP